MASHLVLRGSTGDRRIGPEGLSIGRATDCGLRLDSRLVSSRHARVAVDAHGWWIEDEGSTNGTYVDGRRIARREPLLEGSVVEIGDERLQVASVAREPSMGAARPRPAPAPKPTARPPRSELTDATMAHPVVLAPGTLRIGRDSSNDIIVRDPNVSRFHAELHVSASRCELRDLGSCNGTRLDGALVDRAQVGAGAEIGVGAYRIVLRGNRVVSSSGDGCLVAERVEQHGTGGVRVLCPTDVRLVPGEFVAVIGEAGSGKSTLVKILAGVTRPSGGSVRVEGDDVALRLPDLGYVPQTEILHRSLTAREALSYGARLRLPPDTSRAELDVVVDRVLADLDLTEHAGKRIDVISGGQQRRVGVAMELLGSPRILFVDEPTTGLDALLAGKLMQVLRDLASGDRAVVAVTHETRFLRRCDRLLVMGRGGVLRFDGAPDAALDHFRVAEFDEIYERLALSPGPPSERRSGRQPLGGLRAASGGAPVRECQRSSSSHQLRVLAGRTALVLSRDRRNLAFLVLQVPVLAAASAMLFGGNAFTLEHGMATKSAQLLFVLALVATWVGATDGARALISERAMFVRERALGVRAGPYLASKFVVFGGLAVVQATLLVVVAFRLAPLHRDGTATAIVVGVLLLATLVALASGLLLSALVSTEDQAASVLPLLLVPQLLCAGAIVSVHDMGSLKVLAALVSSRWALAGSGAAMDLPGGASADRGFLRFYADFFDAPWVSSVAIMVLFLCAFGWIALWRLRTAWR